MKITLKLIKQSNYIFVNNKLYIRNYNDKFIRIKQKLPEFISDIDDLIGYDLNYSSNKINKEINT